MRTRIRIMVGMRELVGVRVRVRVGVTLIWDSLI
jgi:hypothetical protein